MKTYKMCCSICGGPGIANAKTYYTGQYTARHVDPDICLYYLELKAQKDEEEKVQKDEKKKKETALKRLKNSLFSLLFNRDISRHTK